MSSSKTFHLYYLFCTCIPRSTYSQPARSYPETFWSMEFVVGYDVHAHGCSVPHIFWCSPRSRLYVHHLSRERYDVKFQLFPLSDHSTEKALNFTSKSRISSYGGPVAHMRSLPMLSIKPVLATVLQPTRGYVHLRTTHSSLMSTIALLLRRTHLVSQRVEHCSCIFLSC